MIRRALFLATLCMLGLIGMISTAAHAQMMNVPNLAGSYNVVATSDRNHLLTGVLVLHQTGTSIVGSINVPAGQTQISGTLNGMVVSGNWRGPTGETGWLTLNFMPPGMMKFSGDYGYNGRKPTGQINGTKMPPTPAP